MSLTLSIVLVFVFTNSLLVSASVNTFNEETLSSHQTIVDAVYYPEGYKGYIYPVHPGTAEWFSLPDHQAKVDACMIPENMLASMTTEELAQTIIYYPLISDIFAYDDWSVGLSVVSTHFNAFREFNSRDDRGSSLVELYVNQATLLVSELDSATLNAFEEASLNGFCSADYEACRSVLNSMVLSVMLSDDTYASTFSIYDKNKLIQHEAEIACRDDIYRVSAPDSVLTVAGDFSVEASYTYLYRVGYTAVSVSSTTVHTPNGSNVVANSTVCMELWCCSDGQFRPYEGKIYVDLPSAYKTTLNNSNYNTYGLNPLANPTVKYNCHSYAWHLQSTANSYWINDPTPYLTDGSYTVVSKMDAKTNDRVVYYYSTNSTYVSPSHSAVIVSYAVSSTQRTFTLKSKWGMSGLYQHSLTNCPYYYYNGENYTSIYDTRFYRKS